MKAGIVGLPNAGKSTLFNAIMKESLAHAANYPFCTIEPNLGKVPVKDPRLNVLTEMVSPQKTIETVLECVDIAGLIKGASTGAGMGNAFLSTIRNVDLILQVVRAFNDPETGQEPTVKDDVDIIEQELILSDMQILEKFSTSKAKDKAKEHIEIAKKALVFLEQEKRLIDQSWDADEAKWLNQMGMLTMKPYIYVCNVNYEDLDKDLDCVKELAAKGQVIVCCATYEFELTQIEHTERTAMDNIIKAAYDKLGLLTFFTVGEKEVRAWTAKKGYTAPQAAGVIHTDFEKIFIRAEIVSYDEFVKHNGWDGARQNGKLRTEGKKYIMQDGDVCFFKI